MRLGCAFLPHYGSLCCFGCPQVQGAETGGERGSGGRLLQVTEIAMTDDKMPREEVLNNTAWCSTGVLQTEILEVFLTV